MPLYEYRCEACGRKTEVLQKLHEAPLTVCPDCGGVLRKQVSAPAFQFKGTGWYVTDYGRSSESERGKSADSDSKSAEPAKSDSAPAPAAGGDKSGGDKSVSDKSGSKSD
jgi:putative FmdB family regulatory protein